MNERQADAAGWALHFGTGAVFTAVYNEIWERTSIKPNLKSGALMGAISGLVGIAIWRATIAAHPKPPVKDYNAYYKHLLLAHIVFGIAAAESYKHSQAKISDNNLNELG